MTRDRAAYMRDYRAQKARIAFKQGEVRAAGRIMAAPDLAERDRQIAELETEVARLKKELAARPAKRAFETFVAADGDKAIRRQPEFPPIELPDDGTEPDGSIDPATWKPPRAKTRRDPYQEFRPVPKTGKKK